MRYPFEVVRDPAAMRALAASRRADGLRVCVVPTMGALHEGHLSLLRIGRALADVLILTVFVNPIQFGPGEDLGRYPRTEARDLAAARAAGVDIAYCPEAAAMYGPDFQTRIEVTELAKPLCGASRPGHFAGVTTVVTKLFHVTLPQVAVFGQKDYQQLAIIRRLVADLDFGIDIICAPIVREADGLAMSSRNAYLDPNERAQAVSLSRGLGLAKDAFAGGQRDGAALCAIAAREIAKAPLAELEYLEIRDADSLAPVSLITGPVVMAVAARFSGARLIDNVVLTP